MDIIDLVHEDRSVQARAFACELRGCSKTFARRSDLVRHHRIHLNDRPFSCDWPGCQRDFIQRSALTVHYRVHTGERPHECEASGCDKAFSDSSSLARHRRIHTGKRPYKCQIRSCQRTFCRKTTLTKHVKRNHGAQTLQSACTLQTRVESTYDYDVSTRSSSPASSSEYPNNEGVDYVLPDTCKTPKRQTRSSALPPSPQSIDCRLRSESSSDSPSGEPETYHSPRLGLAEDVHACDSDFLHRRVSGEATHITPPPRHIRHTREPPSLSMLLCDAPDCAFLYSRHQQSNSLLFTPPSAVHPDDLHRPQHRMAFICPPQYYSDTRQRQVLLGSSCMPSAQTCATLATPVSDDEAFDPGVSSPLLRHCRASSMPASKSVASPADFGSALGLTFGEHPANALWDVGDEDTPPPSPMFDRARRASSLSFPGLQNLPLPHQPRGSFSSFVTHHIEQMEQEAQNRTGEL